MYAELHSSSSHEQAEQTAIADTKGGPEASQAQRAFTAACREG